MKKYIKIFWIIPIVFAMSAYDLISEPRDIPISILMQTSILGKISGSGIDMLAFTFNQLYFLILFQIFFGNIIADKFYTGAAYYFSRIPNRGRWFCRECLKLSLLAASYAVLFLSNHFILCARLSLQPADVETVTSVCELFAICWYLLFLTTLAINILSIVFDRKTGFIFGYAIMSICVILALCCQIKWVNFLDPFCYLLFGQENIWYMASRWFYEFFLIAVLISIGNHIVKNFNFLNQKR